MPKFSYLCTTCGLRFEASAPAAKHKDPAKCLSCGGSAGREMPTDVSGVFQQTVTGPTPQNTGIHSLDTHIDRVIGQHAKQGWQAEDLRRKDKRAVLAATGATSADLSLNPDGTYRVRTAEEKAVHERALAIHLKSPGVLPK